MTPSVSKPRSGTSSDDLIRGLGWFSIGLGVAEMLAPRRLAGVLGMNRSATLLSAYGVREITTGLGLLRARDKGPWLWGRVGGDAMDIATLLAGTVGHNPRRGSAVTALLTVLGVTALDVAVARAQTGQQAPRTLRASSEAKRRLDARKVAAGLT